MPQSVRKAQNISKGAFYWMRPDEHEVPVKSRQLNRVDTEKNIS